MKKLMIVALVVASTIVACGGKKNTPAKPTGGSSMPAGSDAPAGSGSGAAPAGSDAAPAAGG